MMRRVWRPFEAHGAQLERGALVDVSAWEPRRVLQLEQARYIGPADDTPDPAAATGRRAAAGKG